MGLFKRAEERGIIANEELLGPEFQPEEMPGRESQLKEIAGCFQPMLSGKRGQNVFLFGGTGTGKTTSAKRVFRELEEESPKIKTVYTNCWQQGSKQAIFAAITFKLELILPRRGLSTEEITARINEHLEKRGERIVVALDEADKLELSSEENVLYDLLRNIKNTNVVLIANSREFIAFLDNRVRSSLASETIEFPRYSPIELKEILRKRAEKALIPGSWSAETIALCAAHAAKNGGDARVGINCLWSAAKIAEKKGGKKITIEEVQEAFGHANLSRKTERMNALNEEEKKIYELLEKKGKGITTRELYDALKKAGVKRTERMIRDYLARMESMKLIETREVRGEGENGLTRTVKVRQ